MAITSTGYDGTVDEGQWTKLIGKAAGTSYGVAGIGDWKVTPHPTLDRGLVIAAGSGWGWGVYDTSDTTSTLQGATVSSGSRWDMVVARRNWSGTGGATTFAIITGTATKNLPTRNTTNGVLDDQPIALVQFTAGSTGATGLVDLRVWPGNGGMIAADLLARNYNTNPGTRIFINGEDWVSTITTGGASTWTRVSALQSVQLFGAGPALAGGTPVAGSTQFYIQAGTEVRTTDNSGYSRISWPVPFPNGLLTVQLACGDDWGNGRIAFLTVAGRGDVWGSAGYGNASEVVYVMEGINSQNVWAKIPNQTHRINYVAIGW